ncbi:MAG: LysM peptidoglycan-binding domain-containing protein [Anaerolineae bacterium]
MVWVQTNFIQVIPTTPPVSVIIPTTVVSPSPTATSEYFQPLTSSTSVPTASSTPTPTSSPTPKPTKTPRPTATPHPLFTFHKVRLGDTLIAIAAQHGITTEALLAANDIRDPNNLEPGTQLLIPPREGFRIPVVPHIVTEGDTLLSIAARYGSSVKKIMAANPHLNPDAPLPVGMAIAVPVVFTEEKPVSPVAESGEPTYYTIEEGDIPLTIADQFDVPVELLLAANNITDPTLLQVGRQLLIPPNEGVTQGVPIILYDLTEKDTLLGIASKFGSSVKDILAVNPNLIPSDLRAGETVAIPIIFAPPRPTPAPAKPRATPKPIAPPPSLVEMEQQMVDGVNAERVKADLPPYEVDQQIRAMALAHAQDMVVREYFSHITPEGVTLRGRFAKAGLTDATNVGEDIQRNTRPASEAVQFALNWFMNSRPHRANILHPNHNRIGVGIVEGPPGWYTFVLVFAQR